jgi:hypothetical protein
MLVHRLHQQQQHRRQWQTTLPEVVVLRTDPGRWSPAQAVVGVLGRVVIRNAMARAGSLLNLKKWSLPLHHWWEPSAQSECPATLLAAAGTGGLGETSSSKKKHKVSREKEHIFQVLGEVKVVENSGVHQKLGMS